jgi:PhnB protein
MPQIDPYLTFDGNCAEAMRFYERTLGGKLEGMMTFGESPMGNEMPPGSGDRIMHAALAFDGRLLMASDSMPGQPYQGMHGISLALACKTVDEGKRLFDALAAGGKVTMPFDKTFWADGFGMLVDKFGVPWMVNVSAAQAQG